MAYESDSENARTWTLADFDRAFPELQSDLVEPMDDLELFGGFLNPPPPIDFSMDIPQNNSDTVEDTPSTENRGQVEANVESISHQRESVKETPVEPGPFMGLMVALAELGSIVDNGKASVASGSETVTVPGSDASVNKRLATTGTRKVEDATTKSTPVQEQDEHQEHETQSETNTQDEKKSQEDSSEQADGVNEYDSEADAEGETDIEDEDEDQTEDKDQTEDNSQSEDRDQSEDEDQNENEHDSEEDAEGETEDEGDAETDAGNDTENEGEQESNLKDKSHNEDENNSYDVSEPEDVQGTQDEDEDDSTAAKDSTEDAPWVPVGAPVDTPSTVVALSPFPLPVPSSGTTSAATSISTTPIPLSAENEIGVQNGAPSQKRARPGNVEEREWDSFKRARIMFGDARNGAQFEQGSSNGRGFATPLHPTIRRAGPNATHTHIAYGKDLARSPYTTSRLASASSQFVQESLSASIHSPLTTFHGAHLHYNRPDTSNRPHVHAPVPPLYASGRYNVQAQRIRPPVSNYSSLDGALGDAWTASRSTPPVNPGLSTLPSSSTSAASQTTANHRIPNAQPATPVPPAHNTPYNVSSTQHSTAQIIPSISLYSRSVHAGASRMGPNRTAAHIEVNCASSTVANALQPISLNHPHAHSPVPAAVHQQYPGITARTMHPTRQLYQGFAAPPGDGSQPFSPSVTHPSHPGSVAGRAHAPHLQYAMGTAADAQRYPAARQSQHPYGAQMGQGTSLGPSQPSTSARGRGRGSRSVPASASTHAQTPVDGQASSAAGTSVSSSSMVVPSMPAPVQAQQQPPSKPIKFVAPRLGPRKPYGQLEGTTKTRTTVGNQTFTTHVVEK